MLPELISSGDVVLNELLSGGFQRDVVYLLYGDKKITANILLMTAVNVQKSIANGGFGEGFKVVFLDGNNRFNPYNVAKYAVTHNLSPQKVLENILISRIFTLNQLNEFLEDKISSLEKVKTLLISGINSLFVDFDKKSIEKLLQIVDNIKRQKSKGSPLIILTASLSENSIIRSKEIGRLSYFKNALVVINDDDDRYNEYILVKHPHLSDNRLRKWKPRRPKDVKPSKYATLDSWFYKDK